MRPSVHSSLTHLCMLWVHAQRKAAALQDVAVQLKESGMQGRPTTPAVRACTLMQAGWLAGPQRAPRARTRQALRRRVAHLSSQPPTRSHARTRAGRRRRRRRGVVLDAAGAGAGHHRPCGAAAEPGDQAAAGLFGGHLARRRATRHLLSGGSRAHPPAAAAREVPAPRRGRGLEVGAGRRCHGVDWCHGCAAAAESAARRPRPFLAGASPWVCARPAANANVLAAQVSSITASCMLVCPLTALLACRLASKACVAAKDGGGGAGSQ